MYFKALQELTNLDVKLVEIYMEEMLNLHRGQGLDLYWRETLECPTENEYIGMVMDSTLPPL